MINFRFKNTHFFSVLLMLLLLISCANKPQIKSSENNSLKDSVAIKSNAYNTITVGADNISLYTPILKGKKIAIVANQTSVLHILQRTSGGRSTMGSKMVRMHLVDYLNNNYGIKIQKVFSPEHGFRGNVDAGEHVTNGVDTKTGLPIVSLYGKNKKPTQEQLKGVDIVVFDIQDVGVRFYTYISTLHYVMEACAEANIPLVVLDRPNPNGHYVDGPVLEIAHKSFVGMHPVPLVYGMTIGEYAKMINGENWLANDVECDLTVIPLKNYNHKTKVHLEVRPSPNLPNDKSINLYPSLGFFEGTTINAGRGTEFQFQRYGAPFFPKSEFTYTPLPNFGSKYPKHKGQICNGVDLSSTKKMSSVNLKWIIDAYQKTPKEEKFFGKTFTIHVGTTKLQQQIEQGETAEKIHKSWQKEIDEFKKIRQKYLIYN